MNLDKSKLLTIGVTKLLKQIPDLPIKLCVKMILSTLVALDLAVFLNQCRAVASMRQDKAVASS